jgi:hypothetical protein
VELSAPQDLSCPEKLRLDSQSAAIRQAQPEIAIVRFARAAPGAAAFTNF